jgi:hypothetical protein
MSRWSLAGAAIVAVLASIAVAQSTQAVEARLLFATGIPPRAALPPITLLVGFVVGALAAGRILRKPRRTRVPDGEPPAHRNTGAPSDDAAIVWGRAGR